MSAKSAATAAIQIAIVEDDAGLRAELQELLEAEDIFEVTAVCGSAEEALARLPDIRPSVVLMDINLPGRDGVECVARLKPILPGSHFMMLTVYEDNDRLFKSLVAGANGYLLKRTPPSQIAGAILDLINGGSPMSPQIARRVVQHFRASESPAAGVEALTAQQRAFLDQLAKGHPYKRIAENLGISMDGVRGHIRRIYEKLQVHSRTEAVVKYLQK